MGLGSTKLILKLTSKMLDILNLATRSSLARLILTAKTANKPERRTCSKSSDSVVVIIDSFPHCFPDRSLKLVS